jgi:glycosyltransferase involved in cell wall biosynthesis
MRILMSISSVSDEFGGPIEAVKKLSAVHTQMGHLVEIVSLDSPTDSWVRNCPLKVYALGPSRGVYRFNRKLVPWLESNRRNYDVVIVNGLWQYNSFGAWRALRKSGPPYYVFPHGMLDPWFKRTYPLKHLKKWLYWPWAEYRVLRDARAVLFTCQDERDLARRSFWLYRCNERVVNLGTAPPAGDPDQQRAIFYDQFPQLRGKALVLFLGRIHVKKGCDHLIKAFHRVLLDQRIPEAIRKDLHLVLAGPDQTGWSSVLKILSRDLDLTRRITWTGMLTGDLKWGAFRAANVFILPSHQENFGIAVVEALACELPVVISDKVNIWREIEADGAGFVGTDDEMGTATALSRWCLLPPSEIQAMKGRARSCFRKRFDIRAAARSLLDVLAHPQ